MAMTLFREKNLAKWVGARPAHCGEQVSVHVELANATVAIYTVPLAKSFFLCSAALSIYTGVGIGILGVANAGGISQYQMLTQQLFTAAGSSAPSIITFWPPLEIPAEWYVFGYSSVAGCVVRGYVFGWIE